MTIWPSSDDVDEEPYPEPEQCQWITFRGTLDEPPEYCEEYALIVGDYCAKHADNTDPDAARDWAIEQAMENR